MWRDIFTAFSLYLIIEGMIPFMSPGGFRRAVSMIAQLGDSNLRLVGLVMMVAGVLVLFLVRS